MPNLFSRLYSHRESADRRPLEDFLTEAFADFFGRLDGETQLSLLAAILSPAIMSGLLNELCDRDGLSLFTQVALEDTGKRPDMVLRSGRRTLLALESKIGAVLQQHATAATEQSEAETVHQLETYARWIGKQNAASATWRGALVLLTAWTEAPSGFIDARRDGVMTSVATWKTVGLWLEEFSSRGDAQMVSVALARDLYEFIRGKDLMTKYPSSRDLAAGMLFARSFVSIKAMFDDTIEAVAKHVPKLSAGRRLHSDFWSEANVYWGWFHISRAIRKRPTFPYLAVGLCFEVSELWAADAAKLPAHEPFLFLLCEDDNEKEKIDNLLSGVPDGWSVIDDGWSVIICRPLSTFPQDPDRRVEALQAWAKEETDRFVLCVPDYEAAPTGPAAEKASGDED